MDSRDVDEPPTAEQAAKRASYLELFFDLVFVFAITQLAGFLHGNHNATGWSHAAFLLWLVWFAWCQFTWAGNAIDLERPATRVSMLAVTAAMLLAAVALPDAFGAGAWRFTLPYAAVRVGGLLLYYWGVRHDDDQRAALMTFLPVAVVSPALLLVGAALPPGIRIWVWLAAVVVDVSAALAAGRGEFRVAPEHFAERHALIVIIALGESIVAVGATAAELTPTPALAAAAISAFAVTATMWWAYFGWVQPAAERRIAHEPDHGRRSSLARDLFTFGHLPFVAGTVVFAVAVEEVLLRPAEPVDPFGRLALGVGLVLYLLGFLLGSLRAVGRVMPERLAAAVGCVVLAAFVAPHLAGAAVLALAALIMAGATFAEARRTTPPVPAPL